MEQGKPRLAWLWKRTPTVPGGQEFAVSTPSGERSALEVLKYANFYKPKADDSEKAEYFVRVKWLDSVPESKAINEVDLLGNQNTVCQPTTPKWRHTVERLETYFTNWDEPVN